MLYLKVEISKFSGEGPPDPPNSGYIFESVCLLSGEAPVVRAVASIIYVHVLVFSVVLDSTMYYMM